MSNVKKFRFSIDRGGTFTDIYAETPKGYRVLKLLSVDPANYADAPREGIRRILQEVTGNTIPKDNVTSTDIEWIRMGTTVATNALLERKGERTGFVTSKGFRDLLEIGNQARPKIFDLAIQKPELLYEQVIEIDERVRVLSEYNTPGFQSKAPPSPLIAHHKGEFVQGVTGEWIEILQKPNLEDVKKQLQEMYNNGIRSVAVSLLHSYTFRDHEEQIGKIAQEIGFTQISLSSATLPMIRIVPRAQTAMVDAYLTPLIKKGFMSGFDENIHQVKILFMMSDGGLCPVDHFNGFRAIVSGPAGGVVGYSMTTWDPKTEQPVIGFDMGGTSTDVSRFAGNYNHVFDTTIAGVTIQAPQLDINTVAAGGGSRLFFRSGLFVVGPESSGAHPGPVCYRKGGYLSITDANLFLGRLLPDYFPKIFGPKENEPLDTDSTTKSFQEMTQNINQFYSSSNNKTKTEDEVAYGFIQVANEAMCRPIRSLTEAKGYDASQHILACFGGAGGQHACAIARSLGMRTVFIHRFAGILSAYGLGLADVVNEQQEPAALHYSPENLVKVNKRFEEMCANATKELKSQGFTENEIEFEIYLNLRYDGTDTAIMTMKPDNEDYQKAFVTQYKREYGFVIEGRPIIIDDIRVRAKATASKIQIHKINNQSSEPKPVTYSSTYFEGLGRYKTPVYILSELGSGTVIKGPAIIIDASSTMLVENECEAVINENGDIRITIGTHETKRVGTELDSIQLSVFSHRFMSIAEQMGKTLQRTSISTNIKERLDFSCALFGPDGGLVANAPHLPVHLGSMQEAVRWQIKHLGNDWKDGEVILANHPSAGGSHLPDMTVITPVFDGGKPVFYVASRGHHADIGGITPGSMPPFSRTLEEEGACIKSFKLVRDGVFQEEEVTEILMSPAKIKREGHELPISGTRNLRDNLSDMKAQVAANHKGILLVKELIAHYSLEVVQAYMYHVQNNAETAVRDMLVSISEHNKLESVDSLYAEDFMDDGSRIALKLTIDRNKKTAIFDFTGTEFEVRSNTNAPVSVTKSAVIYCLRCLVNRDIPLNQGCLNPIEIIIPEGSFLCPSDTAAVVGGNVLTSQRVTDVILSAFKASSNAQDETMGYYETIAGGAGAGPYYHGASAVQTHMTNTRITDAEILERRYPVLLREFSVRNGSGGKGKFNGGDGVVREMEFIKNKMTIGILSERRAFEPNGICGGKNGLRGKNLLIKKDGKTVSLGGKNSVQVAKGDRVRILTPGGGGYGAVDS